MWFTRRRPAPDDSEPEYNVEGVEQLYDGGSDPVVDICFVHGLTGNLMETWTVEGKTEPWPATLLRDSLPQARIVTFGYDAYFIKAFSPASRNRLIDHANELLVDLQNDREENNATSRPLIFVAHSMGGLVCKQAILNARHNPDVRYRGIFDSLIGVMFMGTPHRGSWIADWAHIPLKAISKLKSSNESLLEVLRTDSQTLELIQENFMSMIEEQRERGRQVRIFCFFEELPVLGFGFVVEKNSAIFEGYGHISINADHANMVKFETKKSNGFKRVSAELGRWVNGNISIDAFSAVPDADKFCIQDLRAVDPMEMLHSLDQHRGQFFENVSHWFLGSTVYASFLNAAAEGGPSGSSNHLLWIQCPRGTGKTVLLQEIIHRLRQHQTPVSLRNLAYFFCDKANRSLNNPATILRSLMWMLLVQQPQLIPHLRAQYDRSGVNLFTDKLAFYRLADILKLMLADPIARVSYFIIDGLEQCPKSAVAQFYQLFRASIASSTKARWLISSQPLSDIKYKLRSLEKDGQNCQLVSITGAQAEESNKLYMEQKLSQLKQSFGYDCDVLSPISELLTKRSEKTLASLSNVFQRLQQSNGSKGAQIVELIVSDEQQPRLDYSINISHKAFETTKSSFRSKLNNETLFKSLLRTISIDPIWEVVEDLQQSYTLQGLGRISQFLDRLQSYDSAIRKHVENSSNYLALIWGPVQALLCLRRKGFGNFDEVIQDFEKIGEYLPSFTVVADSTINEEVVEELLLLFYQDILEAHLICLQTFEPSFSDISFDPSLSRHKSKLSLLLGHMGHHASLITREVTPRQIREQQATRAHSITMFEQSTDSQYRSEFQALQSRISPFTYDEIFDRAQNGLCQGTAEWLLNDRKYKKWKDGSSSNKPLIWLNGLPGSGKTFMASAVVSDVKTQHQCLYIFASYENSDRITANSLVQSLIFQAALKHPRLQSLLVQTDERDLTTSTKSNSALLKDIVRVFGPFYIIIDGLDEIAESARKCFLEELVALPQSCKNVRLLISARPEDDINRTLAQAAEQFIVHNRNSASIQMYVNTRVPELLSCFAATETVQAEIKRLLAELTPRASGMFLYARMVMDTLAMLSGLHEVQGYLQNLPLKMDEVYHRVIQRIDRKDREFREKARRIIGWIACTPLPMTTWEVEQALLVEDTPRLQPVTGVTRYVQLCGPVVEVSSGYLRFVHFTFKEYIYHSGIESYIDKLYANWDLARTCMHYLCSDVFDPSASTADLIEHISTGKYCLQDYAIIAWSKIIKVLVSMDDAMERYPIGKTLEKLADHRRNANFRPLPELPVELPTKLQTNWPKAYDLLKHTIRFRMDYGWTDWSVQNASAWQHHDPTTISQVSCKIDTQFEQCLSHMTGKERDDKQMKETLLTHYGTNLFKCMFPSCHRHREAFTGHRERYEHTESHARPWKCVHSKCEFSIIGFSSRSSLNRHQAKCLQGGLQLQRLEDRTLDEVKVLIVETARQGDITRLGQLLSYAKIQKMKGSASFYDLRSYLELLAAQRGSVAMMEVIGLHLREKGMCTESFSEETAVSILRSGNPELFRWLLNFVVYFLPDSQSPSSSRPRLNYWFSELSRTALRTPSDSIYSQWEDYLFVPEFGRPPPGYRSTGLELMLPESPKTSFVFSTSAFKTVASNHTLESRLVKTWERFDSNGLLGYGVLGYALKNLAQSSCSLFLAQALVQMGADASFPSRGIRFVPLFGEGNATIKPSGMTVLHLAARNSSAAAAYLIQFLLENGANPLKGWAKRTPGMEAGARTIKRHLGLTWIELIDQYGWGSSRGEGSHRQKQARRMAVNLASPPA